ncbi:MAG: TIGR02757 family protein [Sedimentisphaerales bacterium]|nr:TIGR02757 family protein [Sedimentisphaerales bacterium]
MVGLNRQGLVNKRVYRLAEVLEGLYERYNRAELIPPDPLQFVYKYTEPADMEIAAFLAADLAYGRVQQIEKSLTALFAVMGRSPSAFVRGFNDASRKALKPFKHRFTTGDDISDLLTLLRRVLLKYGSIEQCFLQGCEPTDANIIPALTRFCGTLSQMYAARHNGRVTAGLQYLLANPEKGSPCKRLNLFLRWMVRDDQVDAGLWKSVDKAKLIVPLDVHMGRLCRTLGLYSQKTPSLAAALKITESFLEINPQDPVKYDFALSRIGIVEGCTGKYGLRCKDCELEGFCK